MSLKDEQERFRLALEMSIMDTTDKYLNEDTKTKDIIYRMGFKSGAMHTFDEVFSCYESSPKYKKMLEVIKFYARLTEIETSEYATSVDVSPKARALLKEIGEG